MCIKPSESIRDTHPVQMFVTISRRLPPSWYTPVGIVTTSIYLPLRHDTSQPCQCDPRWEFHYHSHDLCPSHSSPRRNGAFLFLFRVTFVSHGNRFSNWSWSLAHRSTRWSTRGIEFSFNPSWKFSSKNLPLRLRVFRLFRYSSSLNVNSFISLILKSQFLSSHQFVMLHKLLIVKSVHNWSYEGLLHHASFNSRL